MNPYESPKAKVQESAVADEATEKLARGQKFVVYAAMIYFAAFPMQMVLGPMVGLVVALCAVPVALFGVVLVSGGMRLPTVVRVLLVVLMLIPLINLVTLLILNGRATSRLRAAGYRVGFLGASKPSAIA